MLKDIPYSILKKNEREYEIMIFSDRHNISWSVIAKEYNISTTSASTIYHRMKLKQINLYLNHIANVLKKDIAELKALYRDAMKCYYGVNYACAYIEKRFNDILTEYRAGEPGMPAEVIENLPQFKPDLDQETVKSLVAMREQEQLPFTKIAKELCITRSKAMHVYDLFYHQKLSEALKILKDKAEIPEEIAIIKAYHFSTNKSSKKGYEMLIAEHPWLLKSHT